MIKRRALLPVFAAIALVSCLNDAPSYPRRPIHVLTGLPLFWGEGGISDVLNGQAKTSDLIVALERDGPVTAIEKIDDQMREKTHVLLLIQPPALIPEELVALDAWVRSGGAAVILADPNLEWGSTFPPGDPRRAPVRSLLGPLFAHWGLTLVPDPPGEPHVGPSIAGQGVRLLSAGRWQTRSKACVVESGASVARCSLGRGSATLVADADFVNPENWTGTGRGNLGAIRALLREASTQKGQKTVTR